MKPLQIYGIAGAAIVIAWSIYAIRTGRARFQVWIDDRKKNPFAFWCTIFCYWLLAAAFLFLAVKEGLFSN